VGTRELHSIRHIVDRFRHFTIGDGLRFGGVDLFSIGCRGLSLVVALRLGRRIDGLVRLRIFGILLRETFRNDGRLANDRIFRLRWFNLLRIFLVPSHSRFLRLGTLRSLFVRQRQNGLKSIYLAKIDTSKTDRS